MATVAAIATAVPEHRFTLADAKRSLRQIMPLTPDRLTAIEAIFNNAQVQRRYSPFPIDQIVRPRPLGEVSAEYREQTIALGRQVTAACLAEAGIGAREVDYLITVSCTGIMIPSLDAYLINDLGFRPNVRRLPITELGCSAGAAALAQAADFTTAYPSANVLVVAVEFPSLTFQAGNTSIANLVSCALFGDGAAAALVTGGEAGGVRILDSERRLFPDSYEALGFELKETGLHIVLGKQLAALIRCGLRTAVDPLLERHGLTLADLSFLVLHPGGKKLVEAAEEALGARREETQPTWDVLRDFGNLSSASVLFVLREWMQRQSLRPGDRGLLAAFGPGFSVELLLLACA